MDSDNDHNKLSSLKPGQHERRSFTTKVWIAASITALITVALLIFKATFGVLLLVLAGTLIALYFHGLAKLIERKTPLGSTSCLLISTIGSIILLSAFVWFAGDRIAQESDRLTETIPSAYEKAKEQINNNPLGEKAINRISEQAESADAANKLPKRVFTFFKSTFGVLGDIYVVVFIGLMFTASPKLYETGMVKVVPPNGRSKASEVLEKLATNLQKWLKGKLISMLVVAILTAIGLSILNIPLWFVLALIAGLLSFVPNFGPLIALIPAVLMGFMENPTKALLVVGVYVLVQVLESNFITPKIQQQLTSVPPAMIIIGQLLMGVLTGGWGLLLATPILVIVMVLVQELYVKRMEGTNQG